MVRHLLLMLAVGSICSCGKSEGIGDPCIPEDEAKQDFSGYAMNEVSVESRSVQCESRLCLVNHFQGRVGCPKGQTDGTGACETPSGEQVTVQVKAWDMDRPATQTVYCSCRCDGPEPDARYCDCPSGFSCTKLLDDLGLGASELAGSYCIKDGSQFQPTQEGGPTCRSEPDNPVCR